MSTPLAENSGSPNAFLTLLEPAIAVAKGVGRAVLVIVVVAIAIGLGVSIPILLKDWIEALPPAGLAFGAAAVLGVAKELFETLPTAWSFVVKAVADTLPKIFVQVAVAALGVGFAYYAAAPAAANSGRSLNLTFGGPVPPVVMNESDSLLTAYVIFDEWKSELPASDPQRALVNNLVNSLATCLQSPTDTVAISIRAYASSYGPDKENEKLFKDRGKYVASLIATKLQSLPSEKQKQFQVDLREWPSLRTMEIRRLFKDTDESGTYLSDAGALNRRAEIRVRSAGACLAS